MIAPVLSSLPLVSSDVIGSSGFVPGERLGTLFGQHRCERARIPSAAGSGCEPQSTTYSVACFPPVSLNPLGGGEVGASEQLRSLSVDL